MKFKLEQTVEIVISGERGTVQGRAEYVDADTNYYVRYVQKNGVATEAWWQENSLIPVDTTEG